VGHGLNRLNLEAVENTLEGEIYFRQAPAMVFNAVLDARPMENAHQVLGEAPGEDEPVVLNSVTADLLEDIPGRESPLLRLQ